MSILKKIDKIADEIIDKIVTDELGPEGGAK